MKFDMHCHTKEGSIDAKVDIETYIRRLMEKGFDGMLVTDHNSYKGYQTWGKIAASIQSTKPFTVLKGVEYDTRDGGHIIAILPDDVTCRLLELRGLTIRQLERIVHCLGGILGPAHPYGTGFFAFMNTKTGKKHKDIISHFDFIETFNACSHALANVKAKALAQQYQKPAFAGSDAHKSAVIGSAYTTFSSEIKSNNDLIRAVREESKISAGGSLLAQYQHRGRFKKYIGIAGYWLYNKAGALFYAPARRLAYREIPRH